MSDTKRKDLPSGRFVLRIEPELHAVLKEAAREAGLSLNDYCTRKLMVPGANVAGPGAEVVERVARRFGPSLLGVVVYGSWVRGEAADGSDVDVLVVVDATVEVVRGLYRSWDEEPLSWEGRPVEVHFVRLPGVSEPLSGLWAEAALDGVVLFERGLVVSRRLASMRRRLVAGDVSRRRVHGQPYWVEAVAERGAQLARDSSDVERAQVRLRALDVLFEAGSWADVVRESQEVVELTLKGLLRACGVAPPWVHDVSEVLEAERDRLPADLVPLLPELVQASRQLRRDRELAFYGAEDLTPSGFYERADAEKARASARRTVEVVAPHVVGLADDQA